MGKPSVTIRKRFTVFIFHQKSLNIDMATKAEKNAITEKINSFKQPVKNK